MSLKKTLRIAIIFEWISVILSLIASELLESRLPTQLQEYLQWEIEQDVLISELWLLIPLIAILLVGLIASVGLFLFKPWAKKLYIITGIVGFGILPFLGPVVDHALTYTVGEFESVAFGFIVALLLFTKVYDVK